MKHAANQRVFAAALVLGLALLPLTAFAKPTEPATIHKIVDGSNFMVPAAQDAAKTAEAERQSIDRFALFETKQLDQNNRDWNPSNPKWQPVYSRVQADLAVDLPPVLKTQRAQNQTLARKYEADVATNLDAADAKTILSYLAMPEGQRYRTFMSRINSLFATGAAAAMVSNGAAPPALSKEQGERYFQMIQLSYTFQTMIAQAKLAKAAGRDTSGYGALGIMAGAAIRQHADEMAALDAEYGADMPGFTAFTQSPAAENLYTAMARGMSGGVMQSAQTMMAPVMATAKKHEPDWKALYQAQTAK